MLLNADTSIKVKILGDCYQWVPSPQPGVERMMLDRIGDEQARATSIVRYELGSSFSEHVHTGGEEILVLEGTFCDESGSFPKGTYIRNPPNSSHSPFCPKGATIFVKLRQMSDSDTAFVRTDTTDPELWHQQNDSRSECMLYNEFDEKVSMQKLTAFSTYSANEAALVEILVVQGELNFEGDSFGVGSWLRLPKNTIKLLSSLQHSVCFYQKERQL